MHGATLIAGAPVATFSGTAVSLDASKILIFDDTSQALPCVPQLTLVLGSKAIVLGSPSEGLSGLIMGGIGLGKPHSQVVTNWKRTNEHKEQYKHWGAYLRREGGTLEKASWGGTSGSGYRYSCHVLYAHLSVIPIL